MYQTILLAYDGTRECRIALREGAELARCCGAKVHLLSVMPLSLGVSVGEGFNAGTILENDIEQYRKVLDEGLGRIREKGLDTEGHLVSGDPIEQIVNCAREYSADLVVLGHVARRGFARWWKSSVGANLLDELGCSILVAMRTPEPAESA
jgi:nucleotide-binding universal stress UspA family protein